MKICFVLPQILRKPIGGYKIVYEYANRLSSKGHIVYILYLNENSLNRFHLPNAIKHLAIHMFTLYEPKWFPLDRNVTKLSSTDKVQKILNEMDVAIATGADTVDRTLEYFIKAQKYYFIQGHETWLYSEEELNKKYELGFENIVISKWLKTIVDRASDKESFLLQNPIDLNKYKVNKPLCARDKYSIGVLYHDAEHKGFKYALEAIEIARKKYPQIKLYMFGTSEPDFELTDWMNFRINASQNETIEIYNKISLFVCATIREGYGLTGLEAMACGDVLVSTDYESVREYAIDGYNALLSPIQDTSELANNIIRAIEDDDLRQLIVKNGLMTVQAFSWENAVDTLDNILKADKRK